MGSYTGGHNADKNNHEEPKRKCRLGTVSNEILGMASNEITLYQNSLNGSAPVNKMAARAKNRTRPVTGTG